MRTIIPGILITLLCALPIESGAAQPPAGNVQNQARWRAALEKDAAETLGRAAMAELRSARSSVLVRGPVSFPYTVRQPDGSYRPERPAVAAAVRTPRGWVRLGADGARHAFDPASARELDRLVPGRAFWAEPALGEAGCTDPSGILVLTRHLRRERVSAFPCGFAGLTGQAAQIVLAGRITDWSQVPAAQRPAGLPLARFDDRTQGSFRHNSGLYEERMIAIRSHPEWQGQWRRITARQGDPPPLPEIGFPREMLLMAAMGPQRSGGYRVVIDKVLDQPGELLAFVRFLSPGRGCGAIAAVTSPVDIVRLPASPKTVRWVVERQSADCR
jgi:PrcB C-terminal